MLIPKEVKKALNNVCERAVRPLANRLDVITACPNLQSLDLSSCRQLTDAVIKDLPRNLQWLNVEGCQLTDATTLGLANNIKELILY